MVWCCFWPCGQTSPQVYAGLAADESAASSRLIAGSQPLLYAHKRGEKALLFHLPSRGKRNCHGQFRRRGSGYGVTFQPAVVVSAGIGLLRSISIRRMGIPHHRFGAVEKRSQRFSLGAGEKGVLRPLTPRSKDVAARTRARGAQPCFAAKPRHKFVVGMSADESTATFYRIPGSQPECLRHSRRKKSLAGQKNGRHFAVRRKTGIFPAKSAFSCFRTRGKRNCPSAISTPRFGLCKNPRLAGLRAFLSYRRAIFMGHSVYALSSGDRPA